MMTVAVHARWSGQAARAAALRMFIEHAQAQPGVSVHAPRRHRPLVARALPAGMRCVVFTGVGGREVVAVTDRPDPEPAKFELLIEPGFSGVNPADALQREGRHPVPAGSPTDVPGLEVAGTVVATGPDVTAFSVGDRVFGLVGGGGHATRVVANERELARVPDALDDAQAAAAPEAFLTAFDAAVLQAGLQSGDTLLVNGASGGVGTAAVQIGRALGARVVANVRNEALRPRVAELGAEVFGADEAFARVQELGGADVVLELVGGPHMAGNIASIARGGRVIVVGSKPGDEAVIDLRDADAEARPADGDDAAHAPDRGEGHAAAGLRPADRAVPGDGHHGAAGRPHVPAGRRRGCAGRRARARQARQAAARDAGMTTAAGGHRRRRLDRPGARAGDRRRRRRRAGCRV